jgi:hypothetical protein
MRNNKVISNIILFSIFSILAFYINMGLLSIPIIYLATSDIAGTSSTGSTVWSNPDNAFGLPDGSRATIDSGTSGQLRISTFGDQSGLGTYVSARAAINLQDDGVTLDDDELLFKERIAGGSLTTLETFTTATDGDYTEDTNLYYASACSSWSDLDDALTYLQSDTNQVGGSDAFTWSVDSMFFEVTYTPNITSTQMGDNAANWGSGD